MTGGRKELDKLLAALRRRFPDRENAHIRAKLELAHYRGKDETTITIEFHVYAGVYAPGTNDLMGTLYVVGDYNHCRQEIELAELREG